MNELKKKLKKGLLITFEGIDGSGKTTILNKIKNNNIIKSLDPVYTSEPSKLFYTYNILKSFFYSKNNDPIEELFLFMANHAKHINNIIKPHIQKRDIIFCDRYIDSRCAYQGATLNGVIPNPINFISSIHNIWSIKPNLTFFIDINVETSIKRCNMRIKNTKFENKKFLDLVNINFKKIIESDPKRFIILDGKQSINNLEEIIVSKILNMLKNN